MKAKSTHLPLMIFFLITVTSVYAQPVLLTNLSENAGNFISSGNTLYYAALDSLIKSNGTPAGTVLVKKLGEPVVAISPLTLNDHVFIITEESSGKKSLWKSDGTAEGTVKLGAFNSVQPLLVYQSELYLAIDNGITGTELYKLNASLSTVSLIKDIAPGSASGFAGELIESNDLLYFKANSGSGGINIWKSNGSFEGTALAVNLPFDNYEELTDVNGTIFFRRNHHDGVEKAAIWKSNGTSGGTVLVKEFEAEDEYMTGYGV
jgi:ELWxxDGT repeat protein